MCSVLLGMAAPLQPQEAIEAQVKPVEGLQYAIEWRLIRAGTAKLTRSPRSGNGGWRADVEIESVGLVSKLYRISDHYQAFFDSGFCASGTFFRAEEGKRRRETTVHFDREAGKSNYVERDLVKNEIALEKELDIPTCVHDVVAGLNRVRAMNLQPGQVVQLPITDGKRMVSARVEAQEKETVKTPAGTFESVRYEAFLFNDILYKRKGRLFFWISTNDDKLLIQIRAKLNFPVGTISFQLEKTGVI